MITIRRGIAFTNSSLPMDTPALEADGGDPKGHWSPRRGAGRHPDAPHASHTAVYLRAGPADPERPPPLPGP